MPSHGFRSVTCVIVLSLSLPALFSIDLCCGCWRRYSYTCHLACCLLQRSLCRLSHGLLCRMLHHRSLKHVTLHIFTGTAYVLGCITLNKVSTCSNQCYYVFAKYYKILNNYLKVSRPLVCTGKPIGQ